MNNPRKTIEDAIKEAEERKKMVEDSQQTNAIMLLVSIAMIGIGTWIKFGFGTSLTCLGIILFILVMK